MKKMILADALTFAGLTGATAFGPIDNRLLKGGFVIALEPFIFMKAAHTIEPLIDSTLKTFSFFNKKTPFRLHSFLHLIMKFF
ncbi:hypothetical protein [Bacillus pseudomycoides]|uniref:hypothetical protein n=1 Tax=Bacillus pseudomycoides TaxID=64104 RepID=UPI001155EE7C